MTVNLCLRCYLGVLQFLLGRTALIFQNRDFSIFVTEMQKKNKLFFYISLYFP